MIWFAWPRPVAVDLATVAKGPLEVTADDDGKTRVRHIYTVSAPIAGKVLRISHPIGAQGPSLHVGDQVVADETVVALMQPTPPSFLDVRSHDQLEAEVMAADAVDPAAGGRGPAARSRARIRPHRVPEGAGAGADADDLYPGLRQGQI